MSVPLQLADLSLGMKIEVRQIDRILVRGEVVYIGQIDDRRYSLPSDPPGVGQTIVIEQKDGSLYETMVAELGLTKYDEIMRTQARTVQIQRFSHPLNRCYREGYGPVPSRIPPGLHQPEPDPPSRVAAPARHKSRHHAAPRQDRITLALTDQEIRRAPRFVR